MQEQEFKTFTVIIPCYNSEEYAKNALQSIVDTKYPLDKVEVLIIDDGSKDQDSFYKTIEDFINQYPNTFKYYKKNNGNWGSVVNYAKNNNLINNELVFILDSDDKIKKCFFKTVSKKIKNNDILVGSFTVIENKFRYKGQPYYFLNRQVKEKQKYTVLVYPACIVYRKELFIKLDDLVEGISFQDTPLFFDALRKTNKIRWTSKNISTYWRSRPGNTMTSEFNDKKLNAQLTVFEKLKEMNLENQFFWFLLQKNFVKALQKNNITLEMKNKIRYTWAPIWMKPILFFLTFRKIKKVVVYKNEKD